MFFYYLQLNRVPNNNFYLTIVNNRTDNVYSDYYQQLSNNTQFV